MNLCVFPRLAASMILAGAGVVACSGTPAASQAFVNASLQQPTGNGACNLADMTALQLGDGTMPNEPVARVTASGTYSISCRVAKSGSGYTIQIDTANNTGVAGKGGALVMTGTVDSSGNGSNISATMNFAGITYTESDCTITPSFSRNTASDSPAAPSIAPGRIWGHLECPNAPADQKAYVCDVSADFVFENCSQ